MSLLKQRGPAYEINFDTETWGCLHGEAALNEYLLSEQHVDITALPVERFLSVARRVCNVTAEELQHIPSQGADSQPALPSTQSTYRSSRWECSQLGRTLSALTNNAGCVASSSAHSDGETFSSLRVRPYLLLCVWPLQKDLLDAQTKFKALSCYDEYMESEESVAAKLDAAIDGIQKFLEGNSKLLGSQLPYPQEHKL